MNTEHYDVTPCDAILDMAPDIRPPDEYTEDEYAEAGMREITQ